MNVPRERAVATPAIPSDPGGLAAAATLSLFEGVWLAARAFVVLLGALARLPLRILRLAARPLLAAATLTLGLVRGALRTTGSGLAGLVRLARSGFASLRERRRPPRVPGSVRVARSLARSPRGFAALRATPIGRVAPRGAVVIAARSAPARPIEARHPIPSARPANVAVLERFRSDIEGMRGLAVALVVAFHAGLAALLPGGFVGVDVFFVISGFLISRQLAVELEERGRIDLAAFYARRVRRIVPAALLVIVATLALGSLALPPLLRPALALDAAAAAGSVANLAFGLRAGDYFALLDAPSPFLHFWSLALEEQFYLVWPGLIALATLGAARPARRFATLVLIAAAGSFACALALSVLAPVWSFYALPARAWELLVGAGLALAAPRLLRLDHRAAALAGIVGLALVAYAALTFEAALAGVPRLMLPVAGAGLLIAAGTRARHGAVSRLLALRPLRALGRISYGLYLWHWGLLVIPAAALGRALEPLEAGGLMGLAVVLAAASERLVERPIRTGALARLAPSRSLAAAGVASLALIVAASPLADPFAQAPRQVAVAAPVPSIPPLVVARPDAAAPGDIFSTDLPIRRSPGELPPPAALPATALLPVPPDLVPALAAAKLDRPVAYRDGCHVQTDQTPGDAACVYGDTSSSTVVVLFGDSHALAWFPALEPIARARGWRLVSLTMSACNPADIPAWDTSAGRVSKACADWRAAAVERIASLRPVLVAVSGSGGFATADAAGERLVGEARLAAWRAGMTRTLQRLGTSGARVVFIGDIPTAEGDPPVCLSAHPDDATACATPVGRAVNAAWAAEERAVATTTGAAWIDPAPWICVSDPCPAVIGRILVYRDAGHMTATFAATLGPLLATELDRALAAPARREP